MRGCRRRAVVLWMLALFGATVPAQDLASAIAAARAKIEAANVGTRAQAVAAILAALDGLDAAAGVDDSGDAAQVSWLLARAARQREEWPLAERAWRRAERWYSRHPGEERFDLVARAGLAEALGRQTRVDKRTEALALQQELLATAIAMHGAESEAAMWARNDVAVSLNFLDQSAAAAEEFRTLAAWYERRGDEDALHAARINLADAYWQLRADADLLAISNDMVERARKLFPAGHPTRLHRQVDAIVKLIERGLLTEARQVLEPAMSEFRSAASAEDRRSRSWGYALASAGWLMWLEGDGAAALAVLDEFFALAVAHGFEANELLGAGVAAASIRSDLGDHRGVIEVARFVLERNPSTSLAWDNLWSLRHTSGTSAFFLGDFAEAGRMFEQNLQLLTGLFPDPEDHSRRARFPATWHNLGATAWEAGDPAAARQWFEKVLAHEWPVPSFKASAAFVLAWIDHHAQPTAVNLERLLTTYETQRQLEEWRPWRRHLRQRALLALDATSHAPQLERMLADGVRDVLGQIEETLFLADRERAEVLGHVRSDIDWALSLGGRDDALLQRLTFEAIESRRAALLTTPGLGLQRRDASLEATQRELADVREQLGETVQLGAEDHAAITGEALQQLRSRRDRLQREIRAKLTQLGSGAVKVTAADVASRLADGQAVVTFHRYSHWDPPRGGKSGAIDRFVAHVALPRQDTVQRIDLGPAAAIEAAITAWREAIGAPVDRGRDPEPAPDRAAERGRALHQLVFGPLQPVLGKAKTLYVCVDDALHLVPLDALPLDGKRVVGDECALHLLPSLQSLVRPLPKPTVGPATLLAIGGVAFGKTPEPATGSRGGQLFDFDPLPFTRDEVVKIGTMFTTQHRRAPVVLQDQAATKAAFAEQAPKVRFLHVATHGWFAPADLRSLADPIGTDVLSASHGHSPLALCGLALAGANQGRDQSGRLPGVLTAEHLAGLDLRGCELAVLSACRTNVGLRRGGQSIQSLQSALHTAGVRTAVTSLWRVPDALTEELMVRFYRNLWEQKQPAATALWEAKKWLRSRGEAGVQHWAAWVLTAQ